MELLAAGQLRGPDYFILIGYFVLMLGVGTYFYRYMKGLKDYFSGGNKIPWWLSGISFYMASFSAFSFISFSALAYQFGWVAVTIFWMMLTGTLASVLFFAKRWRRARIDSPVEYLETRYSPTIRQLFAWQGIPVRMIDDSLKLVAIGVIVSKAFDVQMIPSMIFSALIMLAYTMMGGLWAVAVTDFLQFIILSIAVTALVPLSLIEVGGVGQFFSGSPEGFFNIITEDYNWIYIVVTILLYVMAYSSVNWALIQRYYCVPKEKDAYKVGWLVVFLQFITPPLILLPALAARQFMPELMGTGDERAVFPLLCARLLPIGMVGLVVAAMFSATLSMLSGDYNVVASVLTNDVYRRLIRPNASQKECVVVGRFFTVLVGLIVLVIAIVLAGTTGEGLVRTMFKLFGIATAPVAVPMMLGLLTKKITNAGSIAGFLCGIAVGLLILWLFPDEKTIAGYIIKQENALLVGTMLATLLASTIISFLYPAKDEEKERVSKFLSKLQTPIGELPEDIQPTGVKEISPFRITGICALIIGLMLMCVLPFMQSKLSLFMMVTYVILLVLLGAGMIYSSKKGASKKDLTNNADRL